MKLFLAYATENHEAAAHLVNGLEQSPFEVVHFNEITANRSDVVEQMRTNRNSLTVLLLSENYLKSATCMDGMLALVQTLEPTGRLIVALTDNVKSENSPNEPERLKLDIDRSSIVIQYQNYWTDTYLSLRKEKWNVPAEKLELYDRAVITARNISNEIAAFLRQVRNAGYQMQEVLAENNYKMLFIKAGLDNDKGFKNFVAQTVINEAVMPVSDVEPALSEAKSIEIVSEIAPEIAQQIVPETVAVMPPIVAEVAAAIVAPAPVETATENEETDPELLKLIPGLDLLKAETTVQTAPETVAEVPAVIVEPIIEKIEAAVAQMPVIEAPIIEQVEEKAIPIPPVMLAPEPIRVPIQIPVNELITIEKGEATAERIRLERQLAVQPNSPEALYEYAVFIHENDGEIERAKDCLEDAIHHNRRFEKAYLYLGHVVETADQDPLQAKNYYEKVLTINPDSSEAYYRLGRVVMRLFPRQYTISAEYFKRGLELNAEHAEMHFLYGKLLSNAFKRYTRARRHLKAAIRLKPNHSEAYLELARLYQTEFGENDRSRRYYLSAVQISPELHTPENNTLFDVDADEVAAMLTPKPKVEKVDSVVLITGATSGIGLATARKFAAQGYRLILNGRRKERLEALKAELELHYDAEVLLLPFDVRNASAVFESINNIPNNWLNIDILVNNAGLAKGLAPIHEGDIHHWNNMIDTNLKGLLFVTRAVSPEMVARRRGHIINVGSLAGKEVYYRGNVYCATKFAVDALTRAMRIDLVSHGVRVSSVSPGHVEETEFATVRFDGDAQRAAIYDDFNPLTSRDVADAIFFLVSTPEHVGIHDIALAGAQQAGATTIDRSGRKAVINVDVEADKVKV